MCTFLPNGGMTYATPATPPADDWPLAAFADDPPAGVSMLAVGEEEEHAAIAISAATPVANPATRPVIALIVPSPFIQVDAFMRRVTATTVAAHRSALRFLAKVAAAPRTARPR